MVSYGTFSHARTRKPETNVFPMEADACERQQWIV